MWRIKLSRASSSACAWSGGPYFGPSASAWLEVSGRVSERAPTDSMECRAGDREASKSCGSSALALEDGRSCSLLAPSPIVRRLIVE